MTEVAPGVDAIMLRPEDNNSPHLYWVRGPDGGVLIDAGHGEDDISRRVVEAVDRLRGDGPAPHTLLITDRFDEHCGGFPALRSAFPGMTVHAGSGDADAIAETAGAAVDGVLEGGETFEVAGDPARTVRAIATRGHTGGSMCYLLEPDGVLFSGDCVLSQGSTAVHLDLDGDMAAYVRSLHTLAGLDAALLLSFPANPSPTPPRSWPTSSPTARRATSRSSSASATASRTSTPCATGSTAMPAWTSGGGEQPAIRFAATSSS